MVFNIMFALARIYIRTSPMDVGIIWATAASITTLYVVSAIVTGIKIIRRS